MQIIYKKSNLRSNCFLLPYRFFCYPSVEGDFCSFGFAKSRLVCWAKPNVLCINLILISSYHGFSVRFLDFCQKTPFWYLSPEQ